MAPSFLLSWLTKPYPILALSLLFPASLSLLIALSSWQKPRLKNLSHSWPIFLIPILNHLSYSFDSVPESAFHVAPPDKPHHHLGPVQALRISSLICWNDLPIDHSHPCLFTTVRYVFSDHILYLPPLLLKKTNKQTKAVLSLHSLPKSTSQLSQTLHSLLLTFVLAFLPT